MCGGIVTALTFGLPEAVRSTRRLLSFMLAYNAGRICSYTMAGGMMGGVGWMVANWSELRQVQLVMQVIAASFMIALGLYLGGWWRGLLMVEALGSRLWGKIEPRARRFMPVHTLSQAFLLGVFWGWLPCGLVYSVLIWSIAVGTPTYGAALMLAFGAGTFPLMLGLGVVSGRFAVWIANKNARQIAGAVVLGFGIFQLVRAISA